MSKTQNRKPREWRAWTVIPDGRVATWVVVYTMWTRARGARRYAIGATARTGRIHRVVPVVIREVPPKRKAARQ
jgi:hypothetical protein